MTYAVLEHGHSNHDQAFVVIQGRHLSEQTALQSVLEPLFRVAQAHQNDRNGYMHSIVRGLFDIFINVERRFADQLDRTDQEIIDSMRKVQVSMQNTCIASDVDIEMHSAALRSTHQLHGQLLHHIVPMALGTQPQVCCTPSHAIWRDRSIVAIWARWWTWW